MRESNWQLDPSAERKADVRYNLACCLSRLAERSHWWEVDDLLNKAAENLAAAAAYRSHETLELLRGDSKAGHDLACLQQKRPEAIQAAFVALGES